LIQPSPLACCGWKRIRRRQVKPTCLLMWQNFQSPAQRTRDRANDDGVAASKRIGSAVHYSPTWWPYQSGRIHDRDLTDLAEVVDSAASRPGKRGRTNERCCA
jgi:hypothetical protein